MIALLTLYSQHTTMMSCLTFIWKSIQWIPFRTGFQVNQVFCFFGWSSILLAYLYVLEKRWGQAGSPWQRGWIPGTGLTGLLPPTPSPLCAMHTVHLSSFIFTRPASHSIVCVWKLCIWVWVRTVLGTYRQQSLEHHCSIYTRGRNSILNTAFVFYELGLKRTQDLALYFTTFLN